MKARSGWRLVLAVLLVAEGFTTALRVTGLLPNLAVYGGVALGLIGLRAVAGVLACTSGWLLAIGRPPGAQLARWTLLASAALGTLEIGWRLAPSDLDPAFRWYYVIAYWTYAGAGTWALRGQE